MYAKNTVGNCAPGFITKYLEVNMIVHKNTKSKNNI